MTYLLYSIRSQGWMTRSAGYSTDVSEAKVFDRDDALAMCATHKERGNHKLIPVRQEDLS